MRPARAEVGSYVEKDSEPAFILGSVDCTVANKYQTKIMCIETQKINKLAPGIGVHVKIFYIHTRHILFLLPCHFLEILFHIIYMRINPVIKYVKIYYPETRRLLPYILSGKNERLLLWWITVARERRVNCL
jgi:hypothetical protein